MHELALVAATEWAKANAPMHRDAAEFGRKVALVAKTTKATLEESSPLQDLPGLIASLAARSTPSEMQQSPELHSSHRPGFPASTSRRSPIDSQGEV